MTHVTIPLSDEQWAQLRQRAEQAGIAPEEFLRQQVDQLLQQHTDSFRAASDHVLKKNAELYRRLA